MAQVEGLRFVEKPTAGGEEAQGYWPAPASPGFGRSYDHEDELGHHHAKKSVLAKVKDVAKKLKHSLSLSRKRHGHDTSDDGHFTRDWGIGLDEDDDDEHDPEYHGAPMYESESAADSYKEAATLKTATAGREKGTGHPADGATKTLEHLDSFKERDLQGQSEQPPPVVVADKHVLEAKDIPEDAAAGHGGNKTLTETVSGMLAPAYTVVTEATRLITSKIQSPGAASQDREAMSKQVWDKGIYVKEYLLQKLEPGEDEKALSEVITEAMSPRKKDAGRGEVGVVDKVKGAVTSLLGMEKPAGGPPAPGSEIPWANSVSKAAYPVLSSSKSPPLPVSMSPQVIQVSSNKSQPVSLPPSPHPAPPSTLAQPNPVPSSTIAQPNPVYNAPDAGVIEEEQSNGRVLQAYTN